MTTDLAPMLEEYDRDHQHPLNRALHVVGITLIGGSVVTVWFAPPAGVGMFAAGWAAQFVGHAIEGKKPSFTRDRRFMAIGALWYAREVGSLVARALPQRREAATARG